MKKGIHYWALPVEMSLGEKFTFAKTCGFDGVELVVLKEGECHVNATPRELSEIRKSADDAGIELLSLTNSLNWTCSFTSDSSAIRQKALDTLRRQIDIAHGLGVDSILALPGFVSVAFPVNDLHPASDTSDKNAYHPSEEDIRYDKAYDRALEGFSKATQYAEKEKVTLCVENIWSNFLLSPLEMCTFIDTIGSKRLKSYFDVGNACPYGIPHHWIEILGSRIGRVHVKDYQKGKLTLDAFVELGKGNIDFSAVSKSLKTIGYDGWITAELNVDVSAPERVARETSSIMDNMFR